MPSIRRVLSRAQAVARIHERSFPDDADDLVGVELEWLVRSGVLPGTLVEHGADVFGGDVLGTR